MTWTRGTDGAYTHSGTARSVWVAPIQFPGQAGIRLEGLTYTVGTFDDLWILVFSDGAGGGCFECGINGANYEIRERDPLTRVAAAPVLGPAAHGITGGDHYTMEVRLDRATNGENIIRLYINDSLVGSYQIPAANAKNSYRHVGFASNENNHRVEHAYVFPIVPIFSGRRDVLVAVCDGDVWFSVNGNAMQRAQDGSGAFVGDGKVSLATYRGNVYGVDGENAKKIVVNNTGEVSVENWGVTAVFGSADQFPGATDSGGNTLPGTTTATVVETFLDRIVLAIGEHLYFSAVGDADDFNAFAPIPFGGAFATTNAVPGRIGEPVLAMIQATKGVLVVGCRNSIWRFAGDPALGVPDISPVLITHGVSGLNAMHVVEDGSVLAHTPEGLYLIAATQASASPMSQAILTEGLEIGRDEVDDYCVQVIEDPSRHHLHIFLTQVDASLQPTHFAYSKQYGGFDPRRSGYFPDTFPLSAGPTASVVYLGELIMGTRDGYVLRFDESKVADAVGSSTANIVTKCACVALDSPDMKRDTELRCFTIGLGMGSGDVEYEVYGGNSVEHAYVGLTRSLSASGTVTQYDIGRPINRKLRAPAIVIELKSTGKRMSVEAVEGEWHSLKTARRRVFATPVPEEADPTGGGDGTVSGPGPGDIVTVPPAATCMSCTEFLAALELAGGGYKKMLAAAEDYYGVGYDMVNDPLWSTYFNEGGTLEAVAIWEDWASDLDVPPDNGWVPHDGAMAVIEARWNATPGLGTYWSGDYVIGVLAAAVGDATASSIDPLCGIADTVGSVGWSTDLLDQLVVFVMGLKFTPSLVTRYGNIIHPFNGAQPDLGFPGGGLWITVGEFRKLKTDYGFPDEAVFRIIWDCSR